MNLHRLVPRASSHLAGDATPMRLEAVRHPVVHMIAELLTLRAYFCASLMGRVDLAAVVGGITKLEANAVTRDADRVGHLRIPSLSAIIIPVVAIPGKSLYGHSIRAERG